MEVQQQNDLEFRPWGMNKNTFLMLMHFSPLLAFFTGIGVIAPVVMWVLMKDQDKDVDTHGKEIMNFLISTVIYSIVCLLLSFVLIGIPMLIALGIACIVFAVLGALKANKGEFYKYPLTIRFIK